MTKEEASFILANIDRTQFDEHTNTSLDMAISALEQEPCDDVVSRQAVLNEFYDVENLYNRIKQLPSVRPQEQTVCDLEQIKKEILDYFLCDGQDVDSLPLYVRRVLNIIEKYTGRKEKEL